uniref:CNNM transmembrane domain-containing protein n=1 Tax=Arcella intermedia TaxID=1963864 RepID=A0A6B2L372_9EUKA
MGIVLLLLIVGGLSFGLAFGFVSLDRFVMKVKYGKKHPYAKAIVPFVKMHSQLLVTLMLAFIASVQTIPLFLNNILSPYVAFAISLPMLFFFSEIIPCSICVRWTLTVGYWTRPFIWLLIFVLFPIAWPVAKILDAIHGPASYSITSRPALKELVQVYTEQNQDEGTNREDPLVAAAAATLSGDEVNIILGAMNMREMMVSQAMTPLDEVFMLSDRQEIDLQTIHKLLEEGHTRVPIYHGKSEPKLIVGMALTNVIISHLLHKKHGQSVTVEELEVFQLPCVSASMPLFKILNQFKNGRTQMAIVLDDNDNVTPVGVITLEDIFSCLVNSELADEFDLLREKRLKAEKTEKAEKAEKTTSIHLPPRTEPLPMHSTRSVSQPPLFDPNQLPPPPHSTGHHISHSLQFNQGGMHLKDILLKAKSNMHLSVPMDKRHHKREDQSMDMLETSPLLEVDQIDGNKLNTSLLTINVQQIN